MSTSVFKMQAQIHRAEKIFVLKLLEGKAEKKNHGSYKDKIRIMHLKHGIVSTAYLVMRTLLVAY